MSLMKLDEFCAHYDGDALSGHEMDVTELGPALLAFGDMARIAYHQVDPLSGKQPTVKVQQFRPGSFEVLMGIDLTLVEEVVDLFTGKYGTAAANAVQVGGGLLTVISGGIWVIKRLAEGKPVDRDELINQLQDELLAQHVQKLQENRKFRDSVKKVVKPLSKDGISGLTLKRRDGGAITSIDEVEAEQILNMESDPDTAVRYEDCTVTVGTPQMERPLNLKWRLQHSDYGAISATLLDNDFADEVLRGKVHFYHGAEFNVKLRVEERADTSDSNPTRSFEIVEIRQALIEEPTLDFDA